MTASANESDPAATKAEYSPRLCPATKSGVAKPVDSIARSAAMETVRIAGCVFSVNCNCSAGPLKQTSESANPSAASASSKTLLAAGKFSAKSFPMPAYCEPWPGKRYAIADCRLPIADSSFLLSLIDQAGRDYVAKNQSEIGNR